MIKAFACSSPYCLAAGQPWESTEENGSEGRNAHVKQRAAFVKGEKNKANTLGCQSAPWYTEEWSEMEGEEEMAVGRSPLFSLRKTLACMP